MADGPAGLYAALARNGGTQNQIDAMQTRKELYVTIDYRGYEVLDASLVATVIAEGMPQRP